MPRHRAVDRRWPRAALLAVVAVLCAGCLAALRGDAPRGDQWPTYGNDPGGTRYSPLGQIDRANVARLQVAWTYRTGESGGAPAYAHIAFEATPILVDGTLFVSTPYNRVIALDAETGVERWAYEPKVDRTRRLAIVTSRGVSASSAITRLYGVLTKRVPSTRIGVASNAMWAYAGAPPLSPVR